jgi:hypothetical protein
MSPAGLPIYTVTDIPLAKADKEVKASFWQKGEVYIGSQNKLYIYL